MKKVERFFDLGCRAFVVRNRKDGAPGCTIDCFEVMLIANLDPVIVNGVLQRRHEKRHAEQNVSLKTEFDRCPIEFPLTAKMIGHQIHDLLRCARRI